MSEEEIKEILQEFLKLKEIHSSNNTLTKSFLTIYQEAVQGLLDLYNKEKEKNKEYFKTLCNYEDTLGYYEDTLENLIDKYSELYNINVADEHTIYLRELITDLEKLFKKILNCECKKAIKNNIINDYISKDKIKSKIEKLKGLTLCFPNDDFYKLITEDKIKILRELLEE